MDLSPLPEELLVEIVKVLEWGDILRIRRTSKRLNAISRSLSVWGAMVKNVPPQMLWLERPMKTYSAAELERLFLRRRRAEAGYEAIANRGLPRWRTIEVEEPVMLPFDIVPGGRWLLVPNKKGRILYYDLDQQDRPGRVLVPEKGFLCSPQMSIDVDFTSPYLKFNLAVGSRSGCVPLAVLRSSRNPSAIVIVYPCLARVLPLQSPRTVQRCTQLSLPGHLCKGRITQNDSFAFQNSPLLVFCQAALLSMRAPVGSPLFPAYLSQSSQPCPFTLSLFHHWHQTSS
ncbi:hypothetical protein BDN72DRAFT_262059 [Pluteus cervinus]|uniref:Uncharacterized protein n=1 Tax=Pluteus cervinus TaxID=181527 RepID=A0ACD3AG44_9AGAR|nr:hypothetical protein BDN72DRAFT_262059 [Pluteus cervinus]